MRRGLQFSAVQMHSPLYCVFFASVPDRGDRPLSRRIEHTGKESLFGTKEAAEELLDLAYICDAAYSRFGSEYPTTIWSCCERACFASLCMGDNPRFFGEVRRIRHEMLTARRRLEECGQFLSSNVAEAREAHSKLAQCYLPFLLGMKSVDGVTGKLCVLATKDVLGVCLDTVYRKRVVSNGEYTWLDASRSRQRALRRVRDRTGLTPFNSLKLFMCSCDSPCLKDTDPKGLESLYIKFSALSDRPKPYERENEFIIDMMYDPFMNSDSSYCDKAIAEILGICARRVMRARRVVQTLMKEPSLLLQERIAPAHGMHRYASENHPMNRTSVETRRNIATGLDMVLRADPAAAEGSVTFRFYDPNINTFEKIQAMLHERMSQSLGQSIGSLSSSTFRRICAEYFDERDGRLSFARADHNCCPHCQHLELQVSALEMELKVLETQPSNNDALVETKRATLLEAKRVHDEHVGWDRRVRRHLKKLLDILKALEDSDTEQRIFGGVPNPISMSCPEWGSRKARALLTHQDDMTKPNVPHFVQDSLAEIARYRPDVSAHVSAITLSATVMSHEFGGVQKNSGSVFENVLIDHLLTCRGESLKIVWSDCASVGRSFFFCVAAMQYLVDSGFCDLAMSGYMANCHGKYLADGLFGQWSRRARNENITSIDGLLNIFEKIKRSDQASIQGIIVNPVATVEWQENLARLGYATSPPPEFGWESMNPHYACACRQSVRETLTDDLLSLLEPLMPKFENCVRLTSWPRFDDCHEYIPFEQRALDIPAARLRSRTAKEIQNGRPRDIEWYLCVPKEKAFAESGVGIVPKSTAAIVGYNASGFASRVPLLRQAGTLRDFSWPPDFHGPPHSTEEMLNVAPENWIARKTLHRCGQNPRARYPPLNYFNALHGKPPRQITAQHRFKATYEEPPFPIIEGTCAHIAASRLQTDFAGELSSSLCVLDLYRRVRAEMNLSNEDELDAYLQPRAKAPCDEAKEGYLKILSEKKMRLKKRPVGKRNAYQIFRADQDAMAQMKALHNERRRNGDTTKTLAAICSEFWRTTSADYKRKYEDLVEQEDERIEREYVEFREWLKERDAYLDSEET